jgi:hypothetical protein
LYTTRIQVALIRVKHFPNRGNLPLFEAATKLTISFLGGGPADSAGGGQGNLPGTKQHVAAPLM